MRAEPFTPPAASIPDTFGDVELKLELGDLAGRAVERSREKPNTLASAQATWSARSSLAVRSNCAAISAQPAMTRRHRGSMSATIHSV
ncbi:MAG TPA: hypothetical protein VED87_08115 [Methylocystis sp.]|nr:hypothetical protein [Methylocystis sp.]